MTDTRAKLTLNGDAVIEPGALKGTLNQDVISIHSLDLKGMFTFDPSLTSTASCESKIAFIDGDEGVLLHRGFLIDQLMTESNYLEVCYTLLYGEKPTQEEYDELKTTVIRYTIIHEQITRLFRGFRRDSHPMAVMYGVIGVLAAFYHDSLDVNNARHREIAASRLLSKVPTMATIYYKHSIGQPFMYPHSDLSYADNFLNIMFSTPCEKYKVNPILERTVDRILILHADHGQSASTSTVRTAGSSGANPFVYITAGTAPPWGPAHDGAGEAALKMLEEISSVKHIPEFVHRAKDGNDPLHLMGFDHRVYRNYGPRATVMREACHEMLKELGTKGDSLGVAIEPEHIVLNDLYFTEEKLHPSVDFYFGIILKAMDIPLSMFTVIFAMARTAGWITHWNEMHTDGMRIVRLRQLYIGYDKHDFKFDTKY